MKNLSLTIAITDWESEPGGSSIDCGKENLELNEGTIWWYTVQEMCTPVLGNHTAITNDLGLAHFEGLHLTKGVPGQYKFAIKGPVGKVE